MDFVIGGERYVLDHRRVEIATKNLLPEPIQKHLVELGGKQYPPKQVFAKVTGRKRMSFTTQEAIRVLNKLGFVCREVGDQKLNDLVAKGIAIRESPVTKPDDVEDRLIAVESALATSHLAIAELRRRVKQLEVDLK